MAIYRSLGRFRGDARLSTWIYRIAARGANRLVQRRRLNALLSTLLLREPPPAPGPDPSEKTARVHLLDDLLKRLHPRSGWCWCCSRSKGCRSRRSPRSSAAPRTPSGRACTTHARS